MAKITWLGEDQGDTAGPSFTTWRGLKFDKGKPVEITDVGTLARAKGNKYFKVEEEATRGLKPLEQEPVSKVIAGDDDEAVLEELTRPVSNKKSK